MYINYHIFSFLKIFQFFSYFYFFCGESRTMWLSRKATLLLPHTQHRSAKKGGAGKKEDWYTSSLIRTPLHFPFPLLHVRRILERGCQCSRGAGRGWFRHVSSQHFVSGGGKKGLLFCVVGRGNHVRLEGGKVFPSPHPILLHLYTGSGGMGGGKKDE